MKIFGGKFLLNELFDPCVSQHRVNLKWLVEEIMAAWERSLKRKLCSHFDSVALFNMENWLPLGSMVI